jgi:hypothetical protein
MENKKREQGTTLGKAVDLIIVNANIIAIALFTVGAIMGLTPLPKSDETINFLF